MISWVWVVVEICGRIRGGGETADVCDGDLEGDLTPRLVDEQRILRSEATLNILRRFGGLRAGVEPNS